MSPYAGFRKVADAPPGSALAAAPAQPGQGPTTSLDMVAALLGDYENHLYDKGGKNDWHFVRISRIDDTKLTWTNRAGVSWILTITGDKNQLAIGSDSPYYKQGDRIATVQWANGEVKSIMGPGNEPFDRN